MFVRRGRIHSHPNLEGMSKITQQQQQQHFLYNPTYCQLSLESVEFYYLEILVPKIVWSLLLYTYCMNIFCYKRIPNQKQPFGFQHKVVSLPYVKRDTLGLFRLSRSQNKGTKCEHLIAWKTKVSLKYSWNGGSNKNISFIFGTTVVSY